MSLRGWAVAFIFLVCASQHLFGATLDIDTGYSSAVAPLPNGLAIVWNHSEYDELQHVKTTVMGGKVISGKLVSSRPLESGEYLYKLRLGCHDQDCLATWSVPSAFGLTIRGIWLFSSLPAFDIAETVCEYATPEWNGDSFIITAGF
ncbi:MAG: hypothetical protein ABI718_00040 [Acidobacteriota bacterium]